MPRQRREAKPRGRLRLEDDIAGDAIEGQRVVIVNSISTLAPLTL